MKILIIDDDINKISQLKAFVANRLPNAIIEERRSYQSGAKAAVLDSPEIILLDMTMPTFDVGGKETGGRERRYAGVQILRNVKRKGIKTKAIVVTQFERFGEGDEQITIHELRADLSREFAGIYAGTIYYEAADSKWTEQLYQLMAELIREMGETSGMIDLLIVDDDAPKRLKIASSAWETIGKRNVRITEAATLGEAARLLEQRQFDLLILDLNLPLQAGGAPREDGGVRLLRQLHRGGPRLIRPTHIIGLTAFDELGEAFKSEFDEDAWQLVSYRPDSDAWQTAIANKLIYVFESKSGSGQLSNRCDLAIITALKHVELEAVLQLDGGWNEERFEGDDTYYYLGRFARDGKEVSVVAAAAYEMGMAASACLSMKVIQRFRPKFLAMAGITAGIGGNFGDIIIADQTWDYGSGKIRTGDGSKSEFAPAPNYIPIDAALKEAIANFITRSKAIIASIQSKWIASPVGHVLNAKLGPMASGAAVLENEEAIKSIVAHNRKVVAVEMEAYGVYLASRTCAEPRPQTFVAKSICDFGVPPKTDEYQRYAAFTSANFVYEFIIRHI